MVALRVEGVGHKALGRIFGCTPVYLQGTSLWRRGGCATVRGQGYRLFPSPVPGFSWVSSGNWLNPEPKPSIPCSGGLPEFGKMGLGAGAYFDLSRCVSEEAYMASELQVLQVQEALVQARCQTKLQT